MGIAAKWLPDAMSWTLSNAGRVPAPAVPPVALDPPGAGAPPVTFDPPVAGIPPVGGVPPVTHKRPANVNLLQRTASRPPGPVDSVSERPQKSPRYRSDQTVT